MKHDKIKMLKGTQQVPESDADKDQMHQMPQMPKDIEDTIKGSEHNYDGNKVCFLYLTNFMSTNKNYLVSNSLNSLMNRFSCKVKWTERNILWFLQRRFCSTLLRWHLFIWKPQLSQGLFYLWFSNFLWLLLWTSFIIHQYSSLYSCWSVHSPIMAVNYVGLLSLQSYCYWWHCDSKMFSNFC